MPKGVLANSADAFELDSGVRYGEEDSTLIGVPKSGAVDFRGLTIELDPAEQSSLDDVDDCCCPCLVVMSEDVRDAMSTRPSCV